MIISDSAAQFNLHYSTLTGIAFEDTHGDSVKVDAYSLEYPTLRFHYEFWLADDFYICLHADHRQTKAHGQVSNENLAMKIGKFGNYILDDLSKHFDPRITGSLDLEGDDDKLNLYNTHKLNFTGRMDDAGYNAKLMYHLIKAARKFRI